MKKFATYCGLTALAGAAFCVGEAEGWKLVASYPTPGSNPRGYAARGYGYGWILEAEATPHIYQVYWPTGSIYSSWPAPGGAGAWGICYKSPELYVSNNRTSRIYRVTTGGSVLSSFRFALGRPADIYDCPMGPYLYVAVPGRNVIAYITTAGSLLGTFPGPGSRATACAGYSPTPFYVADAETHTVYENGRPVITGIQTPVGMDCTLYIGGDQGNVDLYVVDDASDHIYFYRRSTAVAPASLGRVKALFR